MIIKYKTNITRVLQLSTWSTQITIEAAEERRMSSLATEKDSPNNEEGTQQEHGKPSEFMCCLVTMEDITEDNYGKSMDLDTFINQFEDIYQD